MVNSKSYCYAAYPNSVAKPHTPPPVSTPPEVKLGVVYSSYISLMPAYALLNAYINKSHRPRKLDWAGWGPQGRVAGIHDN